MERYSYYPGSSSGSSQRDWSSQDEQARAAGTGDTRDITLREAYSGRRSFGPSGQDQIAYNPGADRELATMMDPSYWPRREDTSEQHVEQQHVEQQHIAASSVQHRTTRPPMLTESIIAIFKANPRTEFSAEMLYERLDENDFDRVRNAIRTIIQGSKINLTTREMTIEEKLQSQVNRSRGTMYSYHPT